MRCQKECTVAYVQYTNPGAYPPLLHSARVFASAGWDVYFFGTGGIGAGELRVPLHPRIRVEITPYQARGSLQKLHYLGFVVRVLWWCWRRQPMLIYASDLLSTPLALLSNRLLGIPVVYHEHDAPLNQVSSLFMKCLHRSRKSLADRAICVVVPNEARANALRTALAVDSSKIHCVWNCPSRDEASVDPIPDSDGLQLHYHGNISEELVPLSLIDALVYTPADVRLRIIGYETVGSRGYIARIREHAEKQNVADRVEIFAAMNRQELMIWARKAHIGIALFPIDSANQNMQTMVGASNKPFDYLAAGCALLVSRIREWEQTFVGGGVARGCDPRSAQSIAETLHWFREHPSEREAMGLRGRQLVDERWNYEAEFEKVLTAVSRAPSLSS